MIPATPSVEETNHSPMELEEDHIRDQINATEEISNEVQAVFETADNDLNVPSMVETVVTSPCVHGAQESSSALGNTVVEVSDWTPEDEIRKLRDEKICLEERCSRQESHLQKLWRAVACPVCLQPLAKPYDLQCGHMVCVECLLSVVKIWQEERVPYMCPMCREPMVEVGRPNFAVDYLLDQLREALPDEYGERLDSGAALVKARALESMFGPRYTIDTEDKINRCGLCNFEILAGQCSNCSTLYPQLGTTDEGEGEGGAWSQEDANDMSGGSNGEEDGEESDGGSDLDGFIVSDGDEPDESYGDYSDESSETAYSGGAGRARNHQKARGGLRRGVMESINISDSDDSDDSDGSDGSKIELKEDVEGEATGPEVEDDDESQAKCVTDANCDSKEAEERNEISAKDDEQDAQSASEEESLGPSGTEVVSGGGEAKRVSDHEEQQKNVIERVNTEESEHSTSDEDVGESDNQRKSCDQESERHRKLQTNGGEDLQVRDGDVGDRKSHGQAQHCRRGVHLSGKGKDGQIAQSGIAVRERESLDGDREELELEKEKSNILQGKFSREKPFNVDGVVDREDHGDNGGVPPSIVVESDSESGMSEAACTGDVDDGSSSAHTSEDDPQCGSHRSSASNTEDSSDDSQHRAGPMSKVMSRLRDDRSDGHAFPSGAKKSSHKPIRDDDTSHSEPEPLHDKDRNAEINISHPMKSMRHKRGTSAVGVNEDDGTRKSGKKLCAEHSCQPADDRAMQRDHKGRRRHKKSVFKKDVLVNKWKKRHF